MAEWKAHKLAGEPLDALQLKRRDRVVAVADLPGVPEGTPGRVVMVNGFNWLRYRVRFENGVEIGHLDGRHIARAVKERSA